MFLIKITFELFHPREHLWRICLGGESQMRSQNPLSQDPSPSVLPRLSTVWGSWETNLQGVVLMNNWPVDRKSNRTNIFARSLLNQLDKTQNIRFSLSPTVCLDCGGGGKVLGLLQTFRLYVDIEVLQKVKFLQLEQSLQETVRDGLSKTWPLIFFLIAYLEVSQNSPL